VGKIACTAEKRAAASPAILPTLKVERADGVGKGGPNVVHQSSFEATFAHPTRWRRKTWPRARTSIERPGRPVVYQCSPD